MELNPHTANGHPIPSPAKQTTTPTPHAAAHSANTAPRRKTIAHPGTYAVQMTFTPKPNSGFDWNIDPDTNELTLIFPMIHTGDMPAMFNQEFLNWNKQFGGPTWEQNIVRVMRSYEDTLKHEAIISFLRSGHIWNNDE